MQQGGCCDDALDDGGGVTAAADMPLSESTSRMSKSCGPIVENQLHVQHQLVALFGGAFHLGRGRLRVREPFAKKFSPTTVSHACCLGQVEPFCRGGMGLLKPNMSLCAAEGRNAGMHAGRSHGCDTTCRVTRRGVSEGALQSGSAGAGAARGNSVCGEQAHPRARPRHASCRL